MWTAVGTWENGIGKVALMLFLLILSLAGQYDTHRSECCCLSVVTDAHM